MFGWADSSGDGAFTRQPEGPIGQPFYGWFTTGDHFFSGRFSGLSHLRRPLNRPTDQITIIN